MLMLMKQYHFMHKITFLEGNMFNKRNLKRCQVTLIIIIRSKAVNVSSSSPTSNPAILTRKTKGIFFIVSPSNNSTRIKMETISEFVFRCWNRKIRIFILGHWGAVNSWIRLFVLRSWSSICWLRLVFVLVLILLSVCWLPIASRSIK
jgi:hypothetical protein